MADGVNRLSMLDAKLEAQRLSSKPRKQLAHSVAIVSKTAPRIVDKREIGMHYEKVFKACSSKYQGDGPTEAPIEIINTVMADLGNLEGNGSLIQSSKVLNFSSTLDNRFYPQWCYRVLSMSSLSTGEDYQTNDNIETTVSLVLEKLYRLGGYLTKQHQMEMKRTLDALTEKVPQFLPQQDVVDYLTVQNDLTTSDEFIHHYCSSADVTLDSGILSVTIETIWPLPLRLFPYD